MRPSLLLLTLLFGAPASAGREVETWTAALPLQATVDRTGCAPEAEVIKVELPPDLRGDGALGDGTSLLVRDAQGERVPAVYVNAAPRPTTRDAVAEPSTDPTQHLLAGTDRPIDGVRLQLADRRFAVTAQVMRRTAGGTVAHGEPKLLWRIDGREDVDLFVPPTRDPLEVRLQWHHGGGARDVDFAHLLVDPGAVRPRTLSLPVRSQWTDEEGTGHVIVDLPHPIPPAALRLQTQTLVFQRELIVQARGGPMAAEEELGRGQLTRVQIGGAGVDERTLNLERGTAGDRLHVLIPSEGQEALVVDAVELTLPGEALLLHRPPAGPLTVLGGGPRGVVPLADLRVAAPELERMAGCVAVLEPVSNNPAYVPPELASGLTAEGQPFDAERMRWSWEIEGDGAVALLRLPASAAALSLNQMNDVRLLSRQGLQIPYILRRADLRQAIPGVEHSRVEDGAVTRIVVKNPQPDLPIEAVSFRSAARAVQRTVGLKRPAGGSLVFLRLSPMSFVAAPGALMPEGGHRYELGLGMPVGDTLVIEVDNGDDAPIDITSIELWTEGYELIAAVPADGATLVMGDRRTEPPDHDLGLMGPQLRSRDMRVVELGAPSARDATPVSLTERAAVWGGLLVMIGGMVSLLVTLARAAPAAPTPPAST